MENGNGTNGKHEPHWFWRLFGGTILSLVGLLLVTMFSIYQSRISDLQSEVLKLNQEQGNLVRQADLSTKLSNLWTQVREQSAIKEKVTTQQAEIQRLRDDLKVANKDIQTLRERLAVVEGRLAVPPAIGPKKDQ